MSSTIETHNLVKFYGPLRAVDGISITVSTGECFGILGPNGAGKTTTIRMLYGFTPKSEGSLYLFGLDIDSHRRAIKNRIGVCPQENNLDPDLTVRQNLEQFARYFDLSATQARERTSDLLTFVALGNRPESLVSELSGGMQRRLVLARALINRPDLLILDEPTTGLDPQSRHLLWSRLEELKRGGLTTLLTTHYMDEAQRLCDRLVIMDQGKILVTGTPRDLISQHVGATVIEIIAPCSELRCFLATRQLAYEDLDQRLVVYSDDGEALYRELLADHCREGCMLRPATLEDVFLRLTGRELRE